MNKSENNNTVQSTLQQIIHLANTSQKLLGEIPSVDQIHYDEDIVAALAKTVQVMHGISDSKAIGMKVLDALKQFYSAKYVCLIEMDPEMDTWYPRWFISDNPGEENDFFSQNDFTCRLPLWTKAFRENGIVNISDPEIVKESSPVEYKLYQRLNVTAVLACPFYRRSKGFVVIMNPKKHQDQGDLLRLLTYVLMMELNEYKVMQSLVAQAKKYNIHHDCEIHIDLFGGLKISTISDVYEADDFTPDELDLLIWMALHPGETHNAKYMNTKIWGDSVADEGQKTRRAISRIRNRGLNVSDLHLIEKVTEGYRFNPALDLKIDVAEFLKLEKSLHAISSPDVHQKILEEMVALYKGPIPESSKGLHWIDYAQSDFEIKYLNALDKLLKIYSKKGDFTTLHSLARQSMQVVPNNEVAYRWKIQTYKQVGIPDHALRMTESAKASLGKEVYESMMNRIKKQE